MFHCVCLFFIKDVCLCVNFFSIRDVCACILCGVFFFKFCVCMFVSLYV